jgi:hypothetical protein
MRQPGFFSTVLCFFAVSGSSLLAGDVHLVARYDLEASQVEPDRASAALHLRLINPTSQPLVNLELAIADSLFVGEYLATFRAVTIPPGGTVDIERDITMPLREYELWRAGGRPKLYLITTDEEGVTHPQRIELLRERFESAPPQANDPPGPVRIQPAQPGGGGQP